MDGNWSYPVTGTIDESYTKALFNRYRTESVEWRPTNQEEMAKAVKTSTVKILRFPYAPSSWRERACALIKLGYPDLATFDAFRAVVLSERLELAVHEQQHQDALFVLANALFFANSFSECLETLKEMGTGEKAEMLRRFARQGLEQERQFHLRKGLSAKATEEELRAGTVRWAIYPWTRRDFEHRSEESMVPLKEGVERAAQGSCAIKRSKTIRTPVTHECRTSGPNEVWGMFARQDVAAGVTLFRNSTAYAACSQENRCTNCGDNSSSDGVQLSCCSLIFCTRTCMDAFLGPSHNPRDCIGPPTLAKMRNQSVRKICKIKRAQVDGKAEISDKEKVKTSLLQKILASAHQHFQTKSQHPLTYPLIRNLTIARGANEAVEFSLRKDVVSPMSMLESMGIDIFTTPHFDAWVLQTIQARLRANTWERNDDGVEFLGLSPLFSLFNHCCKPNVGWSFGKDGTTIELKTLRPIRAVEECYISYLQPEHLALGRRERNKKLLHWFPECQCLECKEEKERETVQRSGTRVRQPQKKRPRVADDPRRGPTNARRQAANTGKEPVQLLSPDPDSEGEEDVRAFLATIKVDDDKDPDFADANLSDPESGYESSAPKSGKRRRRR
ncbi:hypothetical protein FKW77_006833 [Venturia effusa]|uniref:SET domain-containing protein n=1 Tax=Venturia effusa TaxID=50376 RepID=A0A517LKE6_9PEZI|nr:hypothetical protein FKW77_006833 [Venturia effusa]